MRERREDIAPLAAHFIKKSARRLNRPEPKVTQAALAQLTSYAWPGNVRQLQNVVERSIILWQGGPLTFDLPVTRASEIPRESAERTPRDKTLVTRDELRRQERETIAAALKQTHGKVFGPDGAAVLLGMKPTTLASRISALGLKRKG